MELDTHMRIQSQCHQLTDGSTSGIKLLAMFEKEGTMAQADTELCA